MAPENQNEHTTTTDAAHEPVAHDAVDAHAPADSGEHSEAHGESHSAHPPELENFWNVLAKSSLNNEGKATHQIIKHFDPYVEDAGNARLHMLNQNVFFGILSVILTFVVLKVAMKRRALIPGRLQSAVEMLIEGLCKFFLGILGEKHGARYLPFLVALFLFILINNLMGLVPLLKSSTNAFETNIVLALCVFFYVQWTGIVRNGPKKYILHLMGNPTDAVSWAMVPLMLPLEIIGELIKPLSLSLRLFGNILGEDILLGVFVGIGIAMTAGILSPFHIENPWIGIPLHFPFMFLAALTSTIQALIFSLLASIYIMLMLPHEHEEEHVKE
jgi:F-type H+-transporting ATPase subunit a